MVEYVCLYCKRKIDYTAIKSSIKCPYCGGKILFKSRPNIVKTVKAR